MNLYLLSQNDNTSYCSYEACVVLAKDEESAKWVHPEPEGFPRLCLEPNRYNQLLEITNWATHPNHIRVQYLGKAAEYLGNRSRVLLGFDSEIGAPEELQDYLGLSTEVNI